METQATPHAPAAHPMGKHGHPGARGKAGHSSDAACSMRRMALRQAQEMLGKKIDPTSSTNISSALNHRPCYVL